MTAQVAGQRRRWAGADLIPLPFESTSSATLLFAWINVMTFKTMRQYPELRKLMFNAGGFRVKDEAGFPIIDSRSVYPLEFGIPEVDRCWISSRFRYCPLCLEAGYHSVLFQILPLTCCPFHRVPLSDRCHCCDANTPDIRDARIFIKPYCCDRCKNPLGGVIPSLETHTDFRSIFAQVQSALQPYSSWWLAVKTAHRHLSVDYYDASETQKRRWWNSTEFAKAVVYKQTPRREFVPPSRYPEEQVVTINWVCRYADHVPAYSATSSASSYGEAMYRFTLARLRRWITREDGLSAKEFNDLVVRHNFSERSTCSVRLRAFVAFRCHMESRFVLGGANNLVSQDNAVLNAGLFQNVASYGSRTARLEWLATFLALYASWHARMAHGMESDLHSVWEEAPFYEKHLCAYSRFFQSYDIEPEFKYGQPSFAYENRQAWFEGEVSFLKVEGMSLWPWSRKDKAAREQHHFHADRRFPSDYLQEKHISNPSGHWYVKNVRKFIPAGSWPPPQAY
ncbi:TniQ family protein [Rugamonas aquatica]|uniref:TniQ protein n=1 Tax=Rugamonas aquatica TaxID=2743357 RepID=A0A6A7MVL1_9BURK|nr:hypothetical protein [Rugamonas aquatica]MQA37053.1 hypothetical protein [Rugamonas aquatica]